MNVSDCVTTVCVAIRDVIFPGFQGLRDHGTQIGWSTGPGTGTGTGRKAQFLLKRSFEYKCKRSPHKIKVKVLLLS